MSTATVGAEEEAAPMRTDLEELARIREARYQRRKARIEADPDLDPRVKAWLLDRTIWDTPSQAEELALAEQRITMMRSTQLHATRVDPHPSVFPDKDTVASNVAGVEGPGVEAGRVREWALGRGTHVLDPDTGKLEKIDTLPGGRRKHRLIPPTQSGRRSSAGRDA